LVQIDPPTNSITTSQVFADSSDAASALAGIYSNMRGRTNIGFGNGAISLYCGSSADELLPFTPSTDQYQLSTNTLQSSNSLINGVFWGQAYKIIYQVNASIAGLQASTGVPQTVKNELTGEAKFIRALCNFYMVNLFGDIPLLTTSDYKSNASALRLPVSQVYQLIISDLKDAQNLLPENYSAGNGERIKPNKWAATALLARAYLYVGDYSNAEAQSTSIIAKTNVFQIVSNLSNVFLRDSSETILQWQTSGNNFSPYNATAEGYNIVPTSSTRPPFYYLSDQLLNAFENGDQRKVAWIGSTTYAGTTYYYPYKYKIGPKQVSPGAQSTEYYMVLRLAEQYLIRAEARARQNNLNGAVSDLNIIRARAKLANIPGSLTNTQVLVAIAQERRIELFAEWGHRWLDLKRAGQAGTVLASIPAKSAWQPYQQLYPIPFTELQADPNLVQNSGY